MRSALRLDQAFRALIPFASAFLLLLLGAAPGAAATSAAIMPPLLFMALYYWTIHRPDLMPVWLVLFLGLAEDSLTGGIFGLHALLFLVAHHVLLSQRRFFVSGSFLMLWWGFSLTILLMFLLNWLASQLLLWQGLPFAPTFWRILFSIACFPPVAWAFIRLHRTFLHS